MIKKRFVSLAISFALIFVCLIGFVGCDKKVKEFNVSIDVNNTNFGYVVGNGKYQENELVTIYAIENDYCEFIGWYKDNELICKDKVYQFKIQENIDYDAVFNWKIEISDFQMGILDDDTIASNIKRIYITDFGFYVEDELLISDSFITIYKDSRLSNFNYFHKIKPVFLDKETFNYNYSGQIHIEYNDERENEIYNLSINSGVSKSFEDDGSSLGWTGLNFSRKFAFNR